MLKELTFPAKLNGLTHATEFVADWLEELGCSAGIQMKVSVALDEVLSNIVHYAYPKGEGSFAVRLSFDPSRQMAVMTFLDNGVAFNPLEKKEPDVTLAVEDRPIGGLGIFLVKKMMDDVKYERVDGQNRLTLYKKIR